MLKSKELKRPKIERNTTVSKQKTLTSFFFGAKKDDTKCAVKKEVQIAARSNTVSTTSSAESLFGSKRKSGLFQSQGSFEEDHDPDSEIRKLIQGPQLNNFKRPSLSRSPSLLRSNSSTSNASTQRRLVEEDSGSFKEVTSINSGSRQLSFTSTLTPTISNDSFVMSTQIDDESTVPKRKASTFEGLKLGAPKRIKPLRSNKKQPSSSFSQQKNLSFQNSRLKLTYEQEMVIDYATKKRYNIFYTGCAGTGKSVILRTIIDRLRGSYGKDGVAVTASTGLASATIGGTTLHKWSGVGIGVGSIDQLVKRIQGKYELLANWRNTRVLIIDEISMIDGCFLDKLNAIAKRVRKSNAPFGGIQLVLTGDFFQLPPVQKKDTDAGRSSVFCFESSMWKECIKKTVLLTKVFRQQDDQLVNILNAIRFGEVTPQMARTLKSLDREVQYSDGISPTELYATRREVDASNSRQLDLLPGEAVQFVSVDVAPKEYIKVLDSSVMVDKVVTLKENAQVMMLKNKPESDLVNGSLGKVLFFTTERLAKKMYDVYGMIDEDVIMDIRVISKAIGKPLIRDSSIFKQELNARPMSRLNRLETMLNYAIKSFKHEPIYPFIKWTLGAGRYHYELTLPEKFVVDIPGDRIGLERTQLPLMLCWAISIHKAQGQTIQRLRVDLRNIFEAGQVYVALSRAVAMDTLQILNFNPKKIKADEKVKEFYRKLETV